MVPKAGLEPARPKALDFESSTSTNSIIRAIKRISLFPEHQHQWVLNAENSRAVFLNPQDWECLYANHHSVSTTLRIGVDNQTEMIF